MTLLMAELYVAEIVGYVKGAWGVTVRLGGGNA